MDDARRILARLPEVGVDLAAVTAHLEKEGVEKFNAALDHLEAPLEQWRRAVPKRAEQHLHDLGSYAAGGGAGIKPPDRH